MLDQPFALTLPSPVVYIGHAFFAHLQCAACGKLDVSPLRFAHVTLSLRRLYHLRFLLPSCIVLSPVICYLGWLLLLLPVPRTFAFLRLFSRCLRRCRCRILFRRIRLRRFDHGRFLQVATHERIWLRKRLWLYHLASESSKVSPHVVELLRKTTRMGHHWERTSTQGYYSCVLNATRVHESLCNITGETLQ